MQNRYSKIPSFLKKQLDGVHVQVWMLSSLPILCNDAFGLYIRFYNDGSAATKIHLSKSVQSFIVLRTRRQQSLFYPKHVELY